MRTFIEISYRAFRRQISYRAATIAGLATNFAFGLLRVAVMIALYDQRSVMAGITLQGAITFTALSQASIGFLSLFGWYDLMQSVYTGDIASDLLKPLNLYTFWLGKDLGRTAASFLTRGLPIMFAYELIVDLTYPQSVRQWIYLSIAVALSWLVSFSFRFVINLFSFWIPDAVGIGRFFFMTSTFLSGMLMPLRYYSEWVSTLAHLTPFPHMVNTPIEIYLGILSAPEMAAAIALQFFWAVSLIVIGQIIMQMGVRHLVIQGG